MLSGSNHAFRHPERPDASPKQESKMPPQWLTPIPSRIAHKCRLLSVEKSTRIDARKKRGIHDSLKV